MKKRIFIIVIVSNLLFLNMPSARAMPGCNLQGGEIYSSPDAVSSIEVCDPGEPPLPTPPPPPPTGPAPTNTGSNTSLTYFTSDGSDVVDRPILLVEGYDPDDSIPPEFYYSQLPADFKQWMKTNHRDLVILNFNDYSIDLKVLASQFQSSLLQLNAIKSGNYPTAVIGYSAGGLVARWGLKTMENQGINHDVSVFISYDAPHRGATLPYGVIDGVNDLKDKIPGVFESMDLKNQWNALHSPSAKQLLIGGGSNFLRELENLGYPNNLARFAVANGSDTGTNINLPNGALIFDYKAEIGQISNEYQTIRQERHNPCSYPCDPVRNHDYDRSPGGTRETYKEYWESLEQADADTPAWQFDLDVYYKNPSLTTHTFVNTLSALDIKNFELSAHVTGTMESYGPFDGYAHNHINEPHIKFDSAFANGGSAEINQWLLQYHQPNATVPSRAHKKTSMRTVTNARTEWLFRGTNMISWSAVPGATYYELLRKSGSNYYRIKTVTSPLARIVVGSHSTIAVRACNSHQCGYSDFTPAFYRPNLLPY